MGNCCFNSKDKGESPEKIVTMPTHNNSQIKPLYNKKYNDNSNKKYNDNSNKKYNDNSNKKYQDLFYSIITKTYKISDEFKKILEINNNIIAHLDNTDLIIFNNDKKIQQFKINNIIAKGTYNKIYDISSHEELILAIYNPTCSTNYECYINNFVSSCKINDILYNIPYKCSPKINYIFFFFFNKQIVLAKIMEKIKVDGHVYFKNNLDNTNDKIWFNFISQITYKLIYLQKKNKFLHSDFKPNNVMAKNVSSKIYNYNSSDLFISNKNNPYKFNFNLYNLELDWIFIDFGFSSLESNSIKYRCTEFTYDEIIFNTSRDITLMFYMLYSLYPNIPIKVGNFLKKSLSDVTINNIKFNILSYKNSKKSSYTELYYSLLDKNFSNPLCNPYLILKNINDLVLNMGI